MTKYRPIVSPQKIELAANLALVIAVIVLIGGAASYFQERPTKPEVKTGSDEAALHLPGRQAAIEEAKKNGQKDYSYTSGFNPGIGGQ